MQNEATLFNCGIVSLHFLSIAACAKKALLSTRKVLVLPLEPTFSQKNFFDIRHGTIVVKRSLAKVSIAFGTDAHKRRAIFYGFLGKTVLTFCYVITHDEDQTIKGVEFVVTKC